MLDPAAETPTGSSDSSDRGPAGGGPPESDLDDLRRRFAEAGEAERARIAEHLLQFAPWADIWRVASRETIIELFPQLELPGTLRQAWARHLGIAGTAPGN